MAQRKEVLTKSQILIEEMTKYCLDRMILVTMRDMMLDRMETKHKRMIINMMMLISKNMPGILKMKMEKISSRTWKETMGIGLNLIDMKLEVLMTRCKMSFLLKEDRQLMHNLTKKIDIELLEEDLMLL